MKPAWIVILTSFIFTLNIFILTNSPSYPGYYARDCTDRSKQDLASMSSEISTEAGIEAIIFGTSGLKIEQNKLTIKPYNYEYIGEA